MVLKEWFTLNAINQISHGNLINNFNITAQTRIHLITIYKQINVSTNQSRDHTKGKKGT